MLNLMDPIGIASIPWQRILVDEVEECGQLVQREQQVGERQTVFPSGDGCQLWIDINAVFASWPAWSEFPQIQGRFGIS